MNASALPLALCLVLTANAPADPDADRIFEHAKRVLSAQSYPDPIFYRTTVRVSEGDKDEVEHFHAEAFSGGDIRVEGISDEEQATPHETGGVNFKLSLSIGWNTGAGGQSETDTRDAHRKEAAPDYLGIPLISPSYFFALISGRTEPSKPIPLVTPGLPTIATVTSIGRVYKVSLVGTESLGGLYTYHLHLEPTSHPERYRVRELWVDAYTYQIEQLETQGNFTDAPMSDVPWLVVFQNVDGNVYIKSETALKPLVFHHDRTFASADISFDDIRTLDSSLPILPTSDRDADIYLREPDAR